jgi:la-related protein 1
MDHSIVDPSSSARGLESQPEHPLPSDLEPTVAPMRYAETFT